MNRTLLAATCVATMLVAGGTQGQSPDARVDVVTEWSVAASAAASASGMAPLRIPITFAILHLAMHDAVNVATQGREPYAVSVRVDRRASAHGAAIEAGYRVLLAEFPTRASALTATYQKLLAALPASAETVHGLEIGAAVAQKLLALRANDRRNAVVPHTPRTGAGSWIPTPPAFLPATTAFLAHVTPFTMESPSQFRPAGPPAFASRRWVEDYNEVKVLGALNESTRTPEQTATALFWEPLAGTVWPATIRRLAKEQALDLSASARFQAAAFAAFADSLIACWDAKFHFDFWRPVTGIQNGGTDGNRRTTADSTWLPLAVTPNFPEYPSGHACATAAVAHTIEDFFPHDVLIPARNVLSGEERFFRRASQVVDEVVEARMLLGLHFRSADEDGAEMGRKIARQIRRSFKRRGR